MNRDTVVILIAIVVLEILRALWGRFGGGYLGKKGENLATSQDIAKITNLVKSVEREYQEKLEAFRVELTRTFPLRDALYTRQLELAHGLVTLLGRLHNALDDWTMGGPYAVGAAERILDAVHELDRDITGYRVLLPGKIGDAIVYYRNEVAPYELALRADPTRESQPQFRTWLEGRVLNRFDAVILAVRHEMRIDALTGAAQTGLPMHSIRIVRDAASSVTGDGRGHPSGTPGAPGG